MKLLFICTHNRCRSILAEATANHIGDGRLQAFSAGSTPQDHVHPLTLHSLQRNGIRIEGLRSQSWLDYEHLQPDAIITLCDSAANESCPVWFSQAQQVHWGLADPSAGECTEAERAVRFQSTIKLLTRRMHALVRPEVLPQRGAQLRQTLQDIARRVE